MNSNNSSSCKPKMLVRNVNDVILNWEDITGDANDKNLFQLQICDEFKEWRTIYWGNKTPFKVDNLAPCTCYNFRIKLKSESDWIYFKAATADEGPYTSTMHMNRAIKLGKASVVRKIAHSRPFLLEVENKENKTPLIQAVEIGDAQMVQLLITLGANVNTPLYHNKRTGLMVAVYKNQLQIATILIDKGADVNATDINGLNMLHYAVDSNNIENVKFALEIGLNINCKDNHGLTTLLRAVTLNVSNEIIDLLLENGADKNMEDKNGCNFEKHLSILSTFPQK